MKDIIIKEALPEDAEARIAYSKQVGSETDNLSFGKEGFPISVSDEQETIAAPFICMRNSALKKWELYRHILRLGKSISTLTVWY